MKYKVRKINGGLYSVYYISELTGKLVTVEKGLVEQSAMFRARVLNLEYIQKHFSEFGLVAV